MLGPDHRAAEISVGLPKGVLFYIQMEDELLIYTK